MIFGIYSANAQCTDWVQPEPPSTFSDFSTAPCIGASQEIENGVPSSIAFQLGNVMAGGEYAYSLCNGPSAGTWVIDFTIMAPSGAIDASGSGDGDGCTITWTASESGEYTLIINEEGQCGVQNTALNGYPKVATISGGADCPLPPVMIPGAESFEGGELPECWKTVDEDVDGFGWDLLYDSTLAFDGSYCMISYSWVDLPLTPDNYLITPKLELGSNDSLYYVVRSIDMDYPAEHYSVLVSTTGSDITDFTDVVYTETLSSTSYEGRSIDLSAYDGQSVYIAFRHSDVTDQFAFVIDAVKLPGTINCNPDGVYNHKSLENIVVYPNPSYGVFNVMNSGETDLYVIRVFDISGKEIKEDKVMLNNGSHYQIDLTSYAGGFYTIQFVSPNNTGSLKVVKN